MSAKPLKQLKVIKTALLIETNEVDRITISESMKELGYHVITAEDCAKGLEVMKSLKRINIVICRLSITGISALEFVKTVRQEKRYDSIPIVLTSANDSNTSLFRCLNAGADDYLMKPIKKTALKKLIVNIWKKRKENKMASELTRGEQERDTLDSKINELDQLSTTALQAPVRAIINELNNLQSSGSLNRETTAVIGRLINELSSMELFLPIFADTMEDREMSDEVRQWLSHEFGIGETPVVKPAPVRIEIYDRMSPALEEKRTEYLGIVQAVNFNIWKVDDRLLTSVAYDILCYHGVARHMWTSTSNLKRFVEEVSRKNEDIPCYSFRRVVDSLQLMHICLVNSSFGFTGIEIAAGLLGTLLRCCGHSGTSNTYQILSRGKLALRFNDHLPNESNSAYIGYRLIIDALNPRLPEDQVVLFRRIFLKCILIPDIRKRRRKIIKYQVKTHNKESESDRISAISFISMACDTSFASRTYEVMRFWYNLIVDQRNKELEQERHLNVPHASIPDGFDETAEIDWMIALIVGIVNPQLQIISKFCPSIPEEILMHTKNNLEKLEEIRKDK